MQSFALYRYGLIIVPVVAQAGLFPDGQLGGLLICALLWMLIIQIGERWIASRYQALWLLLELGLIVAIGRLGTEPGILFIMTYSTLIPIVRTVWERVQQAVLFVLLLLAQWTLLVIQPQIVQWMGVLILFMLAGFVQMSTNMERKNVALQEAGDVQRKERYDLETARQQWLEYAVTVESLTQANERNRIAQDLHDDLGHKLVRLKWMLDAALESMSTSPEQAVKLISQVRDQLNESMEAMRLTLRRMRPTQAVAKQYALETLAQEWMRTNEQLIRVFVKGPPVDMYPSQEVALYRNAREAVSNAVRHGGATEIELWLECKNNEIVLTVSNNGEVPRTLPRFGMGLKGMEERVRLLGGRLEVRLEPMVTVVTRLPLLEGQRDVWEREGIR